jgi:predicted amidohydrolase YtcJ
MNQTYQPKFGHCPCCNPAIEMLLHSAIARSRFTHLGTGLLASKVGLAGKSNSVPFNRRSAGSIGQAEANIADIIYINAEVVTVNDEQPTAEAVAVKDGRIMAVGSKEEMLKYQNATTEVIDLNGDVMVPGFIDAHGHFLQQGLAKVVADLLPPPDGKVESIAKVIETLTEWAKGKQQSSEGNEEINNTDLTGWIVGLGYDEAQFLGDDKAKHPDRIDLDKVSTEFPVIAVHSSGHLIACNSMALKLAGIEKGTVAPPGGVIRCFKSDDPDEYLSEGYGPEDPNGVLEETACMQILGLLTLQKPEALATIVEKANDIFAEHGFTTAQDGRASKSSFDALKEVAKTGKLRIDVHAYVDCQMVNNVHEDEWPTKWYCNHLRLAGVKLNLDGSVQGKTAWLSKPYHQIEKSASTDYRGYPTNKDQEVLKQVSAAFDRDLQIQTHCNGDEAAQQYINAVRQAQKKYLKKHLKGHMPDLRPVMIHAQTVSEEQLIEMKELGIIPSFFSSHVFYWGDWHHDETLGPNRANNISPTGWAIKNDMKFSTHNDPPVVLPDAIRLMWATTNRRTRSGRVLGEKKDDQKDDQRVTPLVALKSVTLWAAYQIFEEESKGSIEVGKLADFAILSANPLNTELDGDNEMLNEKGMRNIKVLATIKEGKYVYRKYKEGIKPSELNL